MDTTTPLGYALVGKDGNSLDRTIRLESSTSTYSLAGTCQKVWEKISDYSGTTYVIKDAAGLQLIADTTNKNTRIWEYDHFSYLNSYEGKNFRLDADIDWCGTINSFTGDFDGNGHKVTASGSLFNKFGGTISNLTISKDSTNANFAVTNDGTIKNCINNAQTSSGGIVGNNNGSQYFSSNVNNAEVTGTGENPSYIGGIVGVNNSTATFSNNYYSGNCTTGGVNGTDVENAAKAYKLTFTTNINSVTATLNDYIGVNEEIYPEITRGYKLTELTADCVTKNNEGKYIFKVPEGSTAATFEIAAAVELDALTLDAANDTGIIASGNTLDFSKIEDVKMEIIPVRY